MSATDNTVDDEGLITALRESPFTGMLARGEHLGGVPGQRDRGVREGIPRDGPRGTPTALGGHRGRPRVARRPEIPVPGRGLVRASVPSEQRTATPS